MTAAFLLGVVCGAVSGLLGAHWWHRTHTTRADIRQLDAQWTADDREALKQEAAVERTRAAHQTRARRHAELVARDLTELVIAPTRHPIPLPDRTTP